MRVGLVLPMILVWKTASKDICLIDQEREVFGYLHSRDPSMEGFSCDLEVHLHENGSSDMLHVGNGNGLINSKGKRVVLGRKIVEEKRSTEDFKEGQPN